MSTRAFAHAGRLAADYAAVDWALTPVGDPDSWPQSLRTALSICLASKFPILLWWGPQLSMLYNEAYLPLIHDKHPGSLAAPGREVWPEIWAIIGPMLTGVLAGRGATYSEDQLLQLNRRGFAEECYFTFSYSPIIDESHGVGGVFTAVTETTSRVLSERRLRALSLLGEVMPAARTQQEVLDALASHLADTPDTPGTAVLARDGTSWRTVAASGRPVPAPPPGAVPLRGPVVREGDRAITVPLPVVAEGRELALHCRVSDRLEADGSLVDFLSVAARQAGTGLTAVAELEAQRRRAAALAELDAAKTAFFANISHELRTPLTLLTGPLDDLLRSGDGLSQEQRHERLELADRNARRLRTLVDALLDVTRLEAGRLTPDLRAVDLGALTVELAEVFRPAVEAAGLELRVRVPRRAVQAVVDPQMWERIVYNLLSNALKHTFTGSITVRLVTDDDPGADGQPDDPSGRVARLEVEDTGAGIPEKEQGRVFDRFHRVEGTAARSSEGSGIGLALVHELVHLHAGTVAVSSTPDVGSCFTVTVPLDITDRSTGPAEPAVPSAGLARAAAEEATRWTAAGRVDVPGGPGTARSTPERPGPPDGPARSGEGEGGEGRPGTTGVRRRQVLVVDDSADMRRYVAEVLRELADVTLAPDGEHGLRAVHLARRQGWPVDLVIADIMMPVRDGLSLLRELKADARTAGLPVLLLSARAGDEAALDGLEAGADDYVVKPFTARELRARVRSQLRLAEARDLQTARERAIAMDLQQALLPKVPQTAPGLVFAARYASGTEDTDVGGDFYDALTLPDGRTALVVGDVVGRGPGAAALMGQVRAAWRTETLREPTPAAVLSALHATVVSLDVPLVTCVHGLYDPATGRLGLTSAGHPPPVVCSAGEPAYAPLEPGAPLGVPGPPYRDLTLTLDVDDSVIFYTDGLIETRDSDLDAGMAALARAARWRAPSLEARCDQLLAALRPGPDQEDDIAILAIQAVPLHAPGVRHRRLELEAGVGVPQSVRREIRDLLTAWDMRDVVDAALLLTTELVTNAVLHAGGRIDLLLTARPTLLHVSVTDRHPALPLVDGSDVDSEHGRGLLIVDRISSRWGSDRLPDGKRVWFELDR